MNVGRWSTGQAILRLFWNKISVCILLDYASCQFREFIPFKKKHNLIQVLVPFIYTIYGRPDHPLHPFIPTNHSTQQHRCELRIHFRWFARSTCPYANIWQCSTLEHKLTTKWIWNSREWFVFQRILLHSKKRNKNRKLELRIRCGYTHAYRTSSILCATLTYETTPIGHTPHIHSQMIIITITIIISNLFFRMCVPSLVCAINHLSNNSLKFYYFIVWLERLGLPCMLRVYRKYLAADEWRTFVRRINNTRA